jgi:hypothetical protein
VEPEPVKKTIINAESGATPEKLWEWMISMDCHCVGERGGPSWPKIYTGLMQNAKTVGGWTTLLKLYGPKREEGEDSDEEEEKEKEAGEQQEGDAAASIMGEAEDVQPPQPESEAPEAEQQEATIAPVNLQALRLLSSLTSGGPEIAQLLEKELDVMCFRVGLCGLPEHDLHPAFLAAAAKMSALGKAEAEAEGEAGEPSKATGSVASPSVGVKRPPGQADGEPPKKRAQAAQPEKKPGARQSSIADFYRKKEPSSDRHTISLKLTDLLPKPIFPADVGHALGWDSNRSPRPLPRI